jgi:hypothetical protein
MLHLGCSLGQVQGGSTHEMKALLVRDLMVRLRARSAQSSGMHALAASQCCLRLTLKRVDQKRYGDRKCEVEEDNL